jgi:hypothetical protein
MRTNTTTKSFTIALVLTTVLATPSFAREAKQPRTPDQQPQTVVQRVVKHLKQLFGLPIIPIPDDSGSNTTTPSNP